MEFLPLILIFIFFISLILSLLSFYSTKTSFQIVKEMGLGYNLANLFDCYNISKEITEPNDQITLCGNSIPTKDIIKNIKKNGFKTIRFPVTWMHFIDDTGKVNPKWMERVIEVVDWIIDFK